MSGQIAARVVGSASVVLGGGPPSRGGFDSADPAPFLPSRKQRKFMGLQDELAVAAVGHALGRAGLTAPLGTSVGLYLAVGYIPFLEADLAPVLAGSVEDGRFSPRRFGTDGSQRAHPFLTFRCLPNMPAYHVSAAFGLSGPYVVAYPGGGQLGLVLEEAVAALATGRLSAALVVGVTHQRNFLVERHFEKQLPPIAPDALRDAAACLVLVADAPSRAAFPGLGALELGYEPSEDAWPRRELARIDGEVETVDELGPAALPDLVHRAFSSGASSLSYDLRARDGLTVHALLERAPNGEALP